MFLKKTNCSAEKIADILKSYASVLGISGGDNPDAESVALAAAKIRAEGAKAETLEDLRKLVADSGCCAGKCRLKQKKIL